MTDQELVRLVAEKVMEWRVEPAEAISLGLNDEDIEEYCHKPEYWFDEQNKARTLKMFQPLTNANHRDMVVEAMRTKGYWCRVLVLPTKIDVEFYQPDGNSGHDYHDDTGHAVCLAALEAVGEVE